MKKPMDFEVTFHPMPLIFVSQNVTRYKSYNTNPHYLNCYQQSLKFCYLNPSRSLRWDYDKNHKTTYTTSSYSSFICQFNPCIWLYKVWSSPEKIAQMKNLCFIYGIKTHNTSVFVYYMKTWVTPGLDIIKMWYCPDCLKSIYFGWGTGWFFVKFLTSILKDMRFPTCFKQFYMADLQWCTGCFKGTSQ